MLAVLVLLTAPVGASAREVYVPGYGADAVFVLDAASGQQIGAPISTGKDSSPYTLAITPDGSTVYVTNEGTDTVVAIDTRTKTPVATIPVGQSPFGIAITPDGRRAFVSNANDKTVSVIDLTAKQVIGAPIPVEENSYGIAITPDGSRVLVANNDAASISVIDARTLQVIGAPIAVGEDPSGVAISPNGLRAYVGNHGSDSISVIDLATNQVTPTIPGFTSPEFVAITPSGRAAFVSEAKGVAGFDLTTNLLTGAQPLTDGAGQLAVVPAQSPVAALALPKRIRPGVPAEFSGVGSSDPDGAVVSYAWSFAGGGAQVAGATASHGFGKPGKYDVTLTVGDEEGCSVASVFTGQTASCSGNPAATITKTVTVAYPGVKASCPKRAGDGCKVAMLAVKWKGKGKKRKLVRQSRIARAKLKAGGTKILALKPKKNARNKLAVAKKILVAESHTASMGNRATVRFRLVKLKVAR